MIMQKDLAKVLRLSGSIALPLAGVHGAPLIAAYIGMLMAEKYFTKNMDSDDIGGLEPHFLLPAEYMQTILLSKQFWEDAISREPQISGSAISEYLETLQQDIHENHGFLLEKMSDPLINLAEMTTENLVDGINSALVVAETLIPYVLIASTLYKTASLGGKFFRAHLLKPNTGQKNRFFAFGECSQNGERDTQNVA